MLTILYQKCHNATNIINANYYISQIMKHYKYYKCQPSYMILPSSLSIDKYVSVNY